MLVCHEKPREMYTELMTWENENVVYAFRGEDESSEMCVVISTSW